MQIKANEQTDTFSQANVADVYSCYCSLLSETQRIWFDLISGSTRQSDTFTVSVMIFIHLSANNSTNIL